MIRTQTFTHAALVLASLAGLLAACGDKSEGDDTGETVVGDDTGGNGGEDTEYTVEGVSGAQVAEDVASTLLLSTTTYTLSASADITDTELSGTMEWDIVEEDAAGSATTICDSTLALSGTPLSGECEGCDFAFDMSADVIEDNGLTDCTYIPQYTYTEDAVVVNPRLVFFSEYTYDYYGTIYTYNDLLRTGVGFDYTDYGYKYYPGPYYTWIAFDDKDRSRGSADLTDEGDGLRRLDWTWSYVGEYTTPTYYDTCGASYVDNFDYTSSDMWGGTSHTSSLNCGYQEIFDVWEVELQAGDTFLATVDTVAADTAFDPYFFINGPDSCTIGFADEGFDCAYPPTDYTCPAVKLEVDEPGTYQVVVGSFGFCPGTEAEYDLKMGLLVPVE